MKEDGCVKENADFRGSDIKMVWSEICHITLSLPYIVSIFPLNNGFLSSFVPKDNESGKMKPFFHSQTTSQVPNVVSIMKCIALCSDQTGCASLTHQPSTLRCYLKNREFSDAQSISMNGVNSRNIKCQKGKCLIIYVIYLIEHWLKEIKMNAWKHWKPLNIKKFSPIPKICTNFYCHLMKSGVNLLVLSRLIQIVVI